MNSGELRDALHDIAIAAWNDETPTAAIALADDLTERIWGQMTELATRLPAPVAGEGLDVEWFDALTEILMSEPPHDIETLRDCWAEVQRLKGIARVALLTEPAANQPVAEERTAGRPSVSPGVEPVAEPAARRGRGHPYSVHEGRPAEASLQQPVAEGLGITAQDRIEGHEAEGAYLRDPAVPGLPSSFPVGSVSGSPNLPHAYNVREEKAP